MMIVVVLIIQWGCVTHMSRNMLIYESLFFSIDSITVYKNSNLDKKRDIE